MLVYFMFCLFNVCHDDYDIFIYNSVIVALRDNENLKVKFKISKVKYAIHFTRMLVKWIN